ncbi:MAG: ROK family protein [Clostridia bacterium]|nr:ROK family protein [Clostridia bacterium]
MYRIGIDLGGTNIAVGLVNENCEIVTKKSTPTLASRPSDEITADMARLCLEVCAAVKTPITEIESVGIATPGIANLDNGCVEYSCNLPFRRYPIVKKLASLLDIDESKVKIANDANAAAYGEAVAGAARGSSNSIMVTLGTGVGGGIIIDGKIFTGFNHGAGEIGHIVIETNGALCGCGRRGCWEAYSSATALIRMTKEKLEECEKSGRYTLMSKAERISGRTACDAMRLGDEAAKEVYDKYVYYLATGITNMINIFQPEIISLGGGVSNEGQSLIDALLPIINKEQYGTDFLTTAKIRIAELGNDAGMIGAAMM